MQIPLILVLAFLFGLISKTADLLNEHGLKWYRYLDVILGFAWGTIGTILTFVDSNLAVVYLATVLYWFIRIKLEFSNHAIAGVMITLTGLWIAKNNSTFRWDFTFWLFVWLTVSGYINTYLKDNYEKDSPSLKQFLRLRFRYYAGPLLFSFVIKDFLPFYAIILGMAGTELITVWFDRYEITKKSRVADLLGFYLPKNHKRGNVYAPKRN